MRLTENEYASDWSFWERRRFAMAARIIGKAYVDEFMHWWRAPGCPVCKKALKMETAVEVPQEPIGGINTVLLMCGSCAADKMIEAAS